ncbi:FK506-binding protein 15-like [Podarcis raffonei]|uniref:FK506-binding protein 15-like n=1 Tax=Podarcis raffonei TaxID=65483 RepID=UPI00232973C6|nr:FK506-binding protein 15-like [Podarcis raffonei]
MNGESNCATAGLSTQKHPPAAAPAPTAAVQSVFFTTVVHAYLFTNGKYVKHGKYGAAVVGSNETKEYRVLLYISQLQQIATASIHAWFVFTVQPNNYCTFYDDQRQNWSIMFESEMVAVNFSKQLCIAKYNSSRSHDSVLCQDLVLGDGQGVATGDVLEITFTGWLFQNGSLGQVFDSNVNKEKLLRLKLGSGKVIKGWEDGMIGMKRGGRRFLLVPPALAYGPLAEAERIPPDSTLAFEVEVKRVRFTKGAGSAGQSLGPRYSLTPSPAPQSESPATDPPWLTPPTPAPKPGEPAVRAKSSSISGQLAEPHAIQEFSIFCPNDYCPMAPLQWATQGKKCVPLLCLGDGHQLGWPQKRVRQVHGGEGCQWLETAGGERALALRCCLQASHGGTSILKSRDITLPTKVRIVKAMVFPVVMYGSDSGTIKKADRRRIDAFELWCWRRLLRVPWTARRSNLSILKEISPECSLEGQIVKLRLQYFGHLRRREDSLEKTLMLGKMEGTACIEIGNADASAFFLAPHPAIWGLQVPGAPQPHPPLPRTPQNCQPYAGMPYAYPQVSAAVSQLQPVGLCPAPFQAAGDLGSFLLTETRQQNTEIHLAVGKVADKMDQLSVKLEELRKQNSGPGLLPGISSVTMETSMIMSNIQRILQENERLKQEIVEKRSCIEEQNNKIGELIDRNQRYVEQSNLIFEQSNSSLQRTMKHTQARVLHAEQEKVRISKKLAEATAQITQLQLELTRHQKQEMNLHSQLNEALTELERQKAQVSRLRAQLAELEKLSDDMKSRHQEEKLSGKKLDEKVVALEEELADLCVKKENLEKTTTLQLLESQEEQRGSSSTEGEGPAERKQPSAAPLYGDPHSNSLREPAPVASPAPLANLKESSSSPPSTALEGAQDRLLFAAPEAHSLEAPVEQTRAASAPWTRFFPPPRGSLARLGTANAAGRFGLLVSLPQPSACAMAEKLQPRTLRLSPPGLGLAEGRGERGAVRMLGDMDEEDDAFQLPTGGTRLASLFEQDQTATESGNVLFQYRPSKRAKISHPATAAGLSTQKHPPAAAAAAPAATPVPTAAVQSVFFTTVVHAYLFTNGKYVKHGKYGAAVVGSNETKEYRVLLYISQLQQIATASIHAWFVFTVQPNNYCTFYDDQRQNWSIMFESEMAAVNFSKQLCIAKYNSSRSPDSVMCQDLVLGDGQGVATGDVLEITFTGWLFQNGSLGQVFDSNIYNTKLLRVKLGSGKIIKGWEDEIIGMKRGGRRFLLIPPALVYRPLAEAERIPPDSTLAFEVEVKRVWFAKGADSAGQSLGPRDSFTPSPAPQSESPATDPAWLTPPTPAPKPGYVEQSNLIFEQSNSSLQRTMKHTQARVLHAEQEKHMPPLDQGWDQVRISKKLAESMVRISQIQQRLICLQKKGMDYHSQLNEALTESERQKALVNQLQAQLAELQKSSDDMKSRYQEEKLSGKKLDEKVAALEEELADICVKKENLEKLSLLKTTRSSENEKLSPQQEQPEPVKGKVKKIMNEVFQSLRGQFNLEESYTGQEVLRIVLNAIKTTTLQLLESQEEQRGSSSTEEEGPAERKQPSAAPLYGDPHSNSLREPAPVASPAPLANLQESSSSPPSTALEGAQDRLLFAAPEGHSLEAPVEQTRAASAQTARPPLRLSARTEKERPSTQGEMDTIDTAILAPPNPAADEMAPAMEGPTMGPEGKEESGASQHTAGPTSQAALADKQQDLAGASQPRPASSPTEADSSLLEDKGGFFKAATPKPCALGTLLVEDDDDEVVRALRGCSGVWCHLGRLKVEGIEALNRCLIN